MKAPLSYIEKARGFSFITDIQRYIIQRVWLVGRSPIWSNSFDDF